MLDRPMKSRHAVCLREVDFTFVNQACLQLIPLLCFGQIGERSTNIGFGHILVQPVGSWRDVNIFCRDKNQECEIPFLAKHGTLETTV